MVITADPTLHERCNHFKGQGLAKHRTYWHDAIGYNYRMTNICAAIGLAQMERAQHLLDKKIALASKYDALLADCGVETHRPARPDAHHSYWMYSVLVAEGSRDQVMDVMKDNAIETRPVFYPVHTMPMYAHHYARHRVAEEIARRGINLPSWPDMTDADVQRVADTLAKAVNRG